MNRIETTINGRMVTVEIDPRTLLVDLLREELHLTGTHVGCESAQCGACTVHLDGRAVKACTVLAVELDGRRVDTIEGVAPGEATLHPMQAAFRRRHALQCGYCTSGMVMLAIDIERRYRKAAEPPDERTIREELKGNICRCTGYQNIVSAIGEGIEAIRAERTEETSL